MIIAQISCFHCWRS